MRTPSNDSETVNSDNLSAILTCYGAKAGEETLARITARQNPFGQKRGGLGYGGFFVVRPSAPGKETRLKNSIPAGIVNVNLYARQQASRSPIELDLLDAEARFLRFREGERTVASGFIPAAPGWLGKRLADGTPVAKIIQVHGPNLVSIWGKNRCVLFDEGSSCAFCMFDGGGNNVARSMNQVIEALSVMRSTENDREANRHNNLTLTTGLLRENDLENLVRDLRSFKQAFPEFKLALETTPFPESSRWCLRELRDAGLDTLMIPLDVASSSAQREYVPGKARLLEESYWTSVEAATQVFPPNNVTSSIIVGLEPVRITIEAMRQMAKRGVVPEPLPVRWNDERLEGGELRPLTLPEELIMVRRSLDGILATMSAGGPLAGCASCGGCSGVRKKT